MNFDPKEITPEIRGLFTKASSSALIFAETFLTDPTTNLPFKATYPQRLLLASTKKDNWMCCHRRGGKCVTSDTFIIHPDTLKPTSIENLREINRTLVYDFELNKVVWSDCEWIESGKKMCLRIDLGSGEFLSQSSDHEVFTLRAGWVRTDSIKVGDRILAPNSIPVFGNKEASFQEICDEIAFALFDKRITDNVYVYDKESLRIFITEFFIGNGRLLNHFPSPVISFMLWARELSLEIRHLLIRFGIDSRVDKDGNLFIDNSIDVSIFMKTFIDRDSLVTEIKPDRKWEIVTAVRPIGYRSVYDLSVFHSDHNFIGNNCVVHNSYALTITSLWHAVTQQDKYIAVFAPTSTQINAFFDVIDKWINKNPFLHHMKDSVGNHKTPQKRSFITGSSINGFLMGLAGGVEGGKRGITPDVVFVDEGQMFDEDDWKVVTPMMAGDKFRMGKVRTYIAGTTPDNPNNFFYKKIYKQEPQDFENKIFIPITKNPEYTQQMIDDIRSKTPPDAWQTEWLLELSEADAAVFRKVDIYACAENDWEYGVQNIREEFVRFIGVDWDKTQAGTNIAVLQYNPAHGSVQIIYREEIEREKFTYMNACNRILELYDAFRPELVITDQGQGEAQWEYLLMEGERRGSGITSRLVKKAFNEKIEVPSFEDENELEKKRIKPFLVGILQKKFQDRLINLPRHDEDLINQFLGYEVKTITQSTIKYSTHNEHIIDCFLFCMYGIWWLYENEFAKRHGTNHNFLQIVKDDASRVDSTSYVEFWGGLEGPRQSVSGNIPRTTFDNFNTFEYYKDKLNSFLTD